METKFNLILDNIFGPTRSKIMKIFEKVQIFSKIVFFGYYSCKKIYGFFHEWIPYGKIDTKIKWNNLILPWIKFGSIRLKIAKNVERNWIFFKVDVKITKFCTFIPIHFGKDPKLIQGCSKNDRSKLEVILKMTRHWSRINSKISEVNLKQFQIKFHSTQLQTARLFRLTLFCFKLESKSIQS